MTNPLSIVMATYNGMPYICEQIKSIQAQSLTHWRLLVRDDGSTDGTVEAVAHFASGDPRIILLASDVGTRLGPGLNFNAALGEALSTDSDLFFLSDQDDVWDPNKLSVQSQHFPKGGTEDTPLLIHSDLMVVDEDLNPMHDSLVRYMGLSPNPAVPLNYLLTRNFVTGCATACNRRLIEEALPLSDRAIMHDWWLALTAAATGQIEHLQLRLVKYRQHGSNSLGVKGFWHGLNPTNNWVAGWKRGNAEYLATLNQVSAFTDHGKQKAHWPSDSIALLEQYLGLGTLPPYRRLKTAKQLRLRQGNRLLQLIFYIRLLTVRNRMPASRS
ncbi:MAG: glycosyltransferase family 2 protein [Halioglobus sp.]|nr:glycosyltransferase family 2 protein [Halioglobus sp.]